MRLGKASQEVMPGRPSGEVMPTSSGSDAVAHAPGRKARFAGMKNQLK
ncbi:conserved hypothetical protein [Mesotoga infera]|nr:conserved hypothetical protein [Mesotoga infera]